jgi:hypothetical protein
MSAGTVPVSALEFMDALYGMAQDPERWIDAVDAIEGLHPLPDDDPAKPLLMSFAQKAVDLSESSQAPVAAADHAGGRVLSGLLVSPQGLVRGVSGRAVEKLRPFLLSPPEAFNPLRFARRWNEAFSTAMSVASSGKNGGYAHLRLERDGGESVFGVLRKSTGRSDWPKADRSHCWPCWSWERVLIARRTRVMPTSLALHLPSGGWRWSCAREHQSLMPRWLSAYR